VCACNTGETASSSTCSSQHYVSVTSKPVGYIISDVTQTTGVGSERCPWLVSVRLGQRIRVTMFDLATSTSPWTGQRQSAEPQDGRCLLYATLREELEADEIGDHMICSGGETREQVVYTSRDHTLSITIHYAPATRFVLQYEGMTLPPTLIRLLERIMRNFFLGHDFEIWPRFIALASSLLASLNVLVCSIVVAKNVRTTAKNCSLSLVSLQRW